MEDNVADDNAKRRLRMSMFFYEYGGLVTIVGFLAALTFIIIKYGKDK